MSDEQNNNQKPQHDASNSDYGHKADVSLTQANLSDSVGREKADPAAASGNFPSWFLGLGALIVLTSLLFAFCSTRPTDLSKVVDTRPAAGPQLTEEEKLARLGKKTFANNCNSCHVNGMGSPGLYPPLDGSPYVTESAERLIALIIKGIKGDFLYEGVTYGRAAVMPPQPISDDRAVAAVATYIRNQWSNQVGDSVSAEQVAFVRDKYANMEDQWVQADLDNFQDSADFPSVAPLEEAAPSE